jgi:hypothetical protein
VALDWKAGTGGKAGLTVLTQATAATAVARAEATVLAQAESAEAGPAADGREADWDGAAVNRSRAGCGIATGGGAKGGGATGAELTDEGPTGACGRWTLVEITNLSTRVG